MLMHFNSDPDWLVKYHPYDHGNNPKFDKNCKMILALKQHKENGISWAVNQLISKIEDNIILCIVPSSDPDARSPLEKVVQRIACLRQRVINGASTIIRTKKIPKLATGGDRSIEVHIGSLSVVDGKAIEGKDVMVIDDVTTSGNSLHACRLLLDQYKPKSIRLLAIAKTHRDE